MLIVLLFRSQQVLMTTTQEVNEVSIMQLFQQPTEFHIIDKGEALEPEKAFSHWRYQLQKKIKRIVLLSSLILITEDVFYCQKSYQSGQILHETSNL